MPKVTQLSWWNEIRSQVSWVLTQLSFPQTRTPGSSLIHLEAGVGWGIANPDLLLLLLTGERGWFQEVGDMAASLALFGK